jgi:hypothetical protein
MPASIIGSIHSMGLSFLIFELSELYRSQPDSLVQRKIRRWTGRRFRTTFLLAAHSSLFLVDFSGASPPFSTIPVPRWIEIPLKGVWVRPARK